MAEVTFLGVGGAMAANPADDHTALVVQEGAATILLDCGPAIMRQLERVGLTAGAVTHVFISHQHGDHTLGLPMLLLNRVLFWPEHPIVVLATPTVLGTLQQLVVLVYPDLSQRMWSTATFVPLIDGADPTPLPNNGAITVAVASGRHSVPTWGVRLTFPTGQSLVYSGDTATCRSIARLAQDATLLVHEAYFLAAPPQRHDNHSVAVEVGKQAAEAGVRALALVHREITDVVAAEKYRTAAQKHFAGPILVPNAGDTTTF